jgi:hypothetical protein
MEVEGENLVFIDEGTTGRTLNNPQVYTAV